MQPTLASSLHMLRTTQGQDANNNAVERALRDQLLSHVLKPEPHSQSSALATGSGPQARTHAGVNSSNNGSGNDSARHAHSNSAGSNPGAHAQNIDPAIAGSGMMSHSPGESGGEDASGEGRKSGKRELSTSKRAAQNRAAQRAFRQRKEGHIKKLEEQVRDYALLNENFKRMQAENYQLRDYIISLQSRLIESQGEFPQPPVNIDLQQPRDGAGAGAATGVGAPTAPMSGGGAGAGAATAAAAAVAAANQLQASAAQAVAEGKTDPSLMGRSS